MTHTTTVKLAQLVPGETINARVIGRGVEDPALTASIRALGLIMPLAVRRQGDMFQIVDGNRRHLSLVALHTAGELADDAAIPVNIREDDDTAAHEASLAANVMRVPLHPADQYEAFAKMRAAGRSIEQIGTAFTLPAKQVKQRLALGTVIPEVLAAFRADRIDLDCVQAFTIASGERQAEVWQALGKQRHLNAWTIKEAITKKAISSKLALAKFVTAKAYKKAGGTVSTDLFQDQEHWDDAALAIRLASEKVQGEVERLTAEGWLWAALAQDLGEDWRRWRRLYAESRYATPEDEARNAEIDKRIDEINDVDADSVGEDEEEKLNKEYEALEEEAGDIRERMTDEFSADQKKVSGVVIDFDNHSMFTYGIVKPGDAKAAAALDRSNRDETSEQEEGPAGYNDKVTADLRDALSDATQLAIAADPGLAEAVLIVTLARKHTTLHTESWLSVSLSGNFIAREKTAFSKQFAALLGETALPAKFEEAVARVRAIPPKQRAKLIAHLTAAALSKTEATSLIVKMADPHVERIWKPDEAFLTRLSKVQIMEALVEAGCTEAAQKGKDAKKGDLVQIAAKALAKTKWLPLALRAPTYAGPGPTLPTDPEEEPFDMNDDTGEGEDHDLVDDSEALPDEEAA